jgi:hypothetical protein
MRTEKTGCPLTSRGGVWQKLLDALFANLGKVVTNKKLIEVSGQHNYARRIRELRAEGWDIKYSFSPSGYILKSTQKVSKSVDEYINLKLRQKILERDAFRCQLCGNKGNEKYSDGEVVKLEVDHITPLNQGGKTAEGNLWTLCSRCNAGKKSLLAYPETIKNKIVSLNLPDSLRTKLNSMACRKGKTINELLLRAISIGLQKMK